MSYIPSDEAMRGWMRRAYKLASRSPDRSTQNAALILDPSDGLIGESDNHFPGTIDPNNDAVHQVPLKYKLIVHAERGAIYQAARRGNRTCDGTMVSPWAPCPECAQAIVECGIRRLVIHKDRLDHTPSRWRLDVELGLKMCRDSGVAVVMLEGPVHAGVTIRFDGQEITV